MADKGVPMANREVPVANKRIRKGSEYVYTTYQQPLPEQHRIFADQFLNFCEKATVTLYLDT